MDRHGYKNLNLLVLLVRYLFHIHNLIENINGKRNAVAGMP